jgi:hypothetical protein
MLSKCGVLDLFKIVVTAAPSLLAQALISIPDMPNAFHKIAPIQIIMPSAAAKSAAIAKPGPNIAEESPEAPALTGTSLQAKLPNRCPISGSEPSIVN